MVPKFYQNIRLFPDEGTGIREIGALLVQKLHIAFVDNKDDRGTSRYALSFPEYSKTGRNLGRIFRVFAESEDDLQKLNLRKICESTNGYAECSEISEVPGRVYGYIKFERVHPDGSKDAVIRRQVARKNSAVEEVKEAYKSYTPKKLHLPFLHIKSCSTDQVFPLFVNCICENELRNGEFNFYGLSIDGNVPDF